MKRKILLSPLLIIVLIIAFGVSVAGAAILIGTTLQGETNTQSVNLQKGLVGWWKFDGNAKDATLYANNGTVTTATLTNDRKSQSDKAYHFDGSDDYITLSPSILPTAAITVAAWVQLDSHKSWSHFVKNRYSSEGDWLLFENATLWEWGMRSPGTTQQTVFVAHNSTAAWTFLVGTYDGTTQRLYVNGVEVGTPLTHTVTLSQAALKIGDTTTNSPDGKIDDVRIYNRALSATEVTALYQEYDPGIIISDLQKGLVGNWDMNGNAKDKTMYANNGTVTGATLTTDRKGQANKAYSFNGTDDLINVSGITSGGLFGNAHTISAWAKLAGWTTNQSVFGTNITPAGTGDYITIDFTGAGTDKWNARTKLASSGVNENSVASANTYTNDTNWHYLVIVVNADGTIANFYVDGTDQGSASTYTYDLSTMTTAYIGQLPYTSANVNPFNGSIDDVRVYNRALSAAEITALYQEYNPGIQVSDLQKGLVGNWDMNGNAKDKTIYANNGTLNGDAAITANDRKGQTNKAATFDGTGDYVSISASGSFDIKDVSAKPFTISAWIKPPLFPSVSESVVSIGTTDFNAISFAIDNVGKLYIVADTNGVEGWEILQTSTSAVTVNVWSYVTFKRDTSGNYTFYINGVDAGGGFTNANDLYLNNNSVKIAGHYALAAGYSFNGQIDDVRIYNRALTATEVLALYESY